MYIFLYNFDGWKIDATSTWFFWCVFKRQKIVVVLVSLLISFQYFKNQRCLAVSFRCSLISMYFFKVISSHLEISYVIMQCLRTVTVVDICSNLICLQSQWFSADVLWRFSGNGQRRGLFSVSCRFIKTSMKVFLFQ